MTRQAWLPAFDAFADAFFREHEVPGGAVAVVQRGEASFCRGYGHRDAAARQPVTDTTRFGIASLSKSFTALTVLLLAAEGRLDLDDPVTRWLPDFAYPGLRPEAPVRLRHMLSHTSGIPPLRALDYGIHPSQIGDPAQPHRDRCYRDAPPMRTYADLLAYLRRGEGPLVADPGRLVSYSNDAYGLMGAAIEAAAGMPFADAVRTRVFEPLGMDGAGFDSGEAQASGEATTLFTRRTGGEVVASPQWEEAPAHAATGFMKASARDLSRALRFLIDPDDPRLPISRAALAALFTPHGWAEPGTQYGLGWMLGPRRHAGRDSDPVTLIRHGGSLKGISSHQGIVPELGLGGAVLANLDEAPAKRLWLAAVNLALGLPPETPLFVEPPGREGPNDALSGRYGSGEPWGRFEVRQEDGGLHAYSGEHLSHAGRVAWLDPRSFVLVGEAGAWSGGRVHLDGRSRSVAVQQGMRWYVREGVPVARSSTT